MNERIKQLAEQAEQFADDTMNADPAKYDTPGQVKVWRELMQGKFAELIIRECVKVCEAQAVLQLDAYRFDLVEQYTSGTVIQCSKQIKEHFGVE